MAKKKAVVRKGIFLTRNSKGIVVSVHASNGRKLAVMSGYNNRRNAEKGIMALLKAIRESCVIGSDFVEVHATDLTKPVKKAKK